MCSIKKYFLLSMLLCVKISYAHFRDYHVQILYESVGVHANVMRSLVIDKKDFLWMMYEDRVQRYDGHENKEFVLDNNKLLSICCDDENNIWVNSSHRIFRFINDRKGFVEVAYDTAEGLQFGQLVQLKNEPLRLLTSKGLYQLNVTANKFISLKEKPVSKLTQKNSTRIGNVYPVIIIPYFLLLRIRCMHTILLKQKFNRFHAAIYFP